jgi:hypothetical protein
VGNDSNAPLFPAREASEQEVTEATPRKVGTEFMKGGCVDRFQGDFTIRKGIADLKKHGYVAIDIEGDRIGEHLNCPPALRTDTPFLENAAEERRIRPAAFSICGRDDRRCRNRVMKSIFCV